MEKEEFTKGDDEIDLIELLRKLWLGRKLVFKFILIFGSLGLFVAIFSPKAYTAKTVMLPSLSEKQVGGKLSGLASVAGLSFGKVRAGEIPPTIYPEIVKSIPFRKKLLQTKITVEGIKDKVTIQEYYEKIYNPGLLSYIKKYTIGLPGVILRWVKGKDSSEEKLRDNREGLLLRKPREEAIFKMFSNQISVDVNEKEGYITISASMPEAISAAQLAEVIQVQLKKYIVTFKSKKASEELIFIEDLYREKKREFEDADRKLALFKDRNKNIATATIAMEKERLYADYSLKYSIYTDIAKQFEAKKVQVKENTPIFTIVEPVSIPTEKSSPNRPLILSIWLFLGAVIGVMFLFGKEWFVHMKNEMK